MARNRPRGTLVDYLVAAIEPALIMIMVGSLMFFLLDLWYSGTVPRAAALDPLLVRLRDRADHAGQHADRHLAGHGLRRGPGRCRGAGGLGAGGVPAVAAGHPGRRLVGDAQADFRLHAARRRSGRGRRSAPGERP